MTPRRQHGLRRYELRTTHWCTDPKVGTVGGPGEPAGVIEASSATEAGLIVGAILNQRGLEVGVTLHRLERGPGEA